MTIVECVTRTIRKYSMLTGGDSVLIGLSGGPDSVCLLAMLDALRLEFQLSLHAGYIDHRMRPGETPSEIAFCRRLCDSHGISLTTREVDVLECVRKEGLNKQEAARELRYRAFDDMARDLGTTKLALGHTADDQVETVLMRLFRGTGPSGLAGIPPKRGHVIRPLMETTREDIEAFLDRKGLSFITDSSNLRDDYLRNRIRHRLLPLITTISREAPANIARTAEIFREEERYFDIQVTKTLMRLISRKSSNEIDLFLVPLESLDTVILRRVLRRAVDETKGLRGITFGHIEDIIQLIRAGRPGDRLHLPSNIRVIRKYATLLITCERPPRLEERTLDGPGQTLLREASVVLSCKICEIDEIDGYGDGKTVAVFDADRATFPLIVRPRKPGDYFSPIGLGGRKKLQDFFVDEKVPRDERDAVPLLTCRGEIAWVVGYRVDERFKIDKSTKRVLEYQIRPMRT